MHQHAMVSYTHTDHGHCQQTDAPNHLNRPGLLGGMPLVAAAMLLCTPSSQHSRMPHACETQEGFCSIHRQAMVLPTSMQ